MCLLETKPDNPLQAGLGEYYMATGKVVEMLVKVIGKW